MSVCPEDVRSGGLHSTQHTGQCPGLAVIQLCSEDPCPEQTFRKNFLYSQVRAKPRPRLLAEWTLEGGINTRAGCPDVRAPWYVWGCGSCSPGGPSAGRASHC